MKRIFRSIAGKTVLILTVVLSFCVAAVCVFSISLVSGTNFNWKSDSEFLKNYRKEQIYRNIGSIMEKGLIPSQNGLLNPGLMLVYYGEGNYQTVKNYNSNLSSKENLEKYSFEVVAAVKDGEVIDVFRVLDSNNTTIFTKKWALIGRNVTYRVNVYTDPDTPLNWWDALVIQTVRLSFRLKEMVLPIGAAAILLCIAAFTALMCVSGRRPKTEELVPGPFFKIPFDLLLAGTALLGILAYRFLKDQPVFLLAAALVLLSLLLLLCMSFASRVKQKVLIKGAFLYRFPRFLWRLLCRCWKGIKAAFGWLRELFHQIPLVWRTALFLLGLCLIEACIFITADRMQSRPLLYIFLIAEKLVLTVVVLSAAIAMRKLQKMGEVIAAGNLSYQAETKGLFWDFKHHAQNLNCISSGMAQAVEERLKSERMKTELITNVSHDIKTPLTSIINYASLIGNEESGNEKIAEYAEVLLRQSEKLKRLVNDLVEASKASTGNLDVLLSRCDARILISQIDGEYDEKIKAAGLTLVTKVPEQEIPILADSRRMWRVFDNLMNNICKYSQSGTRVYLSLETEKDQAVITFKNTSRDSLDISAEELMERFVRGDASRSTEGNGLGLSIAKSLAELQGGTLKLEIDGDLFKAILKFPLCLE